VNKIYEEKKLKIYWANSIFNAADRNFNNICVEILRREGYIVLNPQENPFNQNNIECNADEIFTKDTEMIKECDIFIACIDQETIDCGVACELGIAWAENKKLLGLYTDFRQSRRGEGRMYKNPYILGCIRSRGKIVTEIEDLLTELKKC
jgi:nucleoside 2-deoxyribosyltransferase